MFALPVLVSMLVPDVLWPAATVGLVEALSSFLCGGVVGHLVDTRDRLALMRVVLVLQNGSVALSCLALWFVPASFWSCFGVVCVFAAINSVAAQIDSICLKKVWLVSLCKEDELASANAALRRIDLLCEVSAPLVVGLLLLAPLHVVLISVASLNLVSLPFELLLLARLHASLPAQQTPASVSSKSLALFVSGWPRYVRHEVPASCCCCCFVFFFSCVRCFSLLSATVCSSSPCSCPAVSCLPFFSLVAFPTSLSLAFAARVPSPASSPPCSPRPSPQNWDCR
jgi:hypothetical protein